MIKYIARRLIMAVFVIIGVAFVTFIMLFLMPGDPAVIIAGQDASPEIIEAIREELNLNEPIVVQFLIYMSGLLRGDLGQSIVSYVPVINLIRPRLTFTMILALASLIVSSFAGILIGGFSALKRGKLPDTVAMSFGIAGICAPSFVTGLGLMYIFSWQLRILPSMGVTSPLSLVLPALNLSLWSTANIVRLSRTSMVEVLNQDYIRTVKALGLSSTSVNFSYVLKNASIPIITIVGLQFGHLMAGSLMTETVFSWPGIGSLLVSSILARDFPVVRASILTIAVTFVIMNLATDVLVALIDPRIKYK